MSLDPSFDAGGSDRRPSTNSSNTDLNSGGTSTSNNPSDRNSVLEPGQDGSSSTNNNNSSATDHESVVGTPVSHSAPPAVGFPPPASSTSSGPSLSPSPSPAPGSSSPTNPLLNPGLTTSLAPVPTSEPSASPSPRPAPSISLSSSPAAATPSNAPERNPPVSTLTSTVSYSSHPSIPTQVRTSPPSPPRNEDRGGLSSGAVTAIAVIAGIVGFVLLFWVGVQVLQSKRRRREEAEMQELDFDPSGNGSALGDPFPRTAVVQRQNSSHTAQDSNSYLNHKSGGLELNDSQYGEGPRMYDDNEYIEPGAYPTSGYPGYGTGVQRQYSTGSLGNAFYADPRQQTAAHGYNPYPGQYSTSSPAHYEVPPLPPQTYYNQPPSGPNSTSGREYQRQPPGPPYRAPSLGIDSGTVVSAGSGYGNMIARATTPPSGSDTNPQATPYHDSDIK